MPVVLVVWFPELHERCVVCGLQQIAYTAVERWVYQGGNQFVQRDENEAAQVKTRMWQP